jgi:hypothetical protein
MLSSFDAFNPNDRGYFINNFPKEFLEFSKENPTFAENYLVKRLLYQSDKSDKKTPIERVVFNNTGSLTNELKGDIQNGWQDLYDNPEYRDMALNLFKYSYFTTGLTFGVNGFSHLLPSDMLTKNGVKDSEENSLSEFMYKILDYTEQDIIDNDVEVYEFIDQWYRNMYKNKIYVPRTNDNNITKEGKDDKNVVIEIETNANTKDKSLIINEKTLVDEQTGKTVKEYEFAPFISKELNGKIYLYKQYSSTGVDATYRLTTKLGFPNYIYEFMRGGLERSWVKGNNTFHPETHDLVISNEDIKAITYEVGEEVDIEGKNIKINNYTIANGAGISINFEYKGTGKSYNVTLKNNNYYYKDGSKVGEKSAMIKLFDKAAGLVERKNCGGK